MSYPIGLPDKLRLVEFRTSLSAFAMVADTYMFKSQEIFGSRWVARAARVPRDQDGWFWTVVSSDPDGSVTAGQLKRYSILDTVRDRSPSPGR